MSLRKTILDISVYPKSFVCKWFIARQQNTIIIGLCNIVTFSKRGTLMQQECTSGTYGSGVASKCYDIIVGVISSIWVPSRNENRFAVR